MATPEWARGRQNSGLDDKALPPWQSAPYRGTAPINLFRAVDMDVRSERPWIADVTETTVQVFFERRDFEITGHMPGTTFIEIFDNQGVKSPVRLEVQVRLPQVFKIAFLFVFDDANHDGSTRSLGALTVVGGLVAALKNVFELQANVVCGSWETAPAVRVPTTLENLAREYAGARGARGEWGKFQSKFVAGADLHVFFLPSVGARTPPGPMFQDGVCVFGDNVTDTQMATALGHVVGQMLGAPVLHDARFADYLMFHARATGQGDPNEAFIPKNTSILMNPF